jgi:hypothetical protein
MGDENAEAATRLRKRDAVSRIAVQKRRPVSDDTLQGEVCRSSVLGIANQFEPSMCGGEVGKETGRRQIGCLPDDDVAAPTSMRGEE